MTLLSPLSLCTVTPQPCCMIVQSLSEKSPFLAKPPAPYVNTLSCASYTESSQVLALLMQESCSPDVSLKRPALSRIFRWERTW